MDGAAKPTADASLTKSVEDYFAFFEVTPGLTKLLSAFTAATFLGFGVRSALQHTRGPHPVEFQHLRFGGGVNFATRALAISSVITLSGYALIVVGVSALLDVSTPRQFGDKMKVLFDNKFRLDRNDSFATFREVLRNGEESTTSSKNSSLGLKEAE